MGCAYVAPWCNWLTRGPFKAESTGSIPVGATKLNRNRNKMLKLLAILHEQSVDELCGNYAAIPTFGVAARLATSISVEDTHTRFAPSPRAHGAPRPSWHQAESRSGLHFEVSIWIGEVSARIKGATGILSCSVRLSRTRDCESGGRPIGKLHNQVGVIEKTSANGFQSFVTQHRHSSARF